MQLRLDLAALSSNSPESYNSGTLSGLLTDVFRLPGIVSRCVLFWSLLISFPGNSHTSFRLITLLY